MANKQIVNSLPKGTELHGKAYSYVIEKAIGQGSFGITYLAKARMQGALGSLNTEVKVAIKEFFMREVNGREGSVVTASGASGLFVDYKKKFRAEAEHLAKLKHENIINVVESFDENNTVYYVMEYIDGGSLDDYISECGRLSEDVVRNYIAQIGSALQFMHQRKMLHLDLKPANIMRRKDGRLVLIDFGLSKQYNEDGEPESTTSIGGGTPGYAPIEQMNYQRGDGFPATMDIYALGATAFKMLIGKRVPEAVVILNEGFPYKVFADLKISQNLKDVIVKAMAPIMRERFQSVDDLMKALKDSSLPDIRIDEPRAKSGENPRNPDITILDTTSVVSVFYFPQTPICAGAYMARINRYCSDINVTQDLKKPWVKTDEKKFAELLDLLRTIKLKPDYNWYEDYEFSETPSTLRISLYDENHNLYKVMEIAFISGEQWGNIQGNFFDVHKIITDAIPGMREYLDSPYYEYPDIFNERQLDLNGGEYWKEYFNSSRETNEEVGDTIDRSLESSDNSCPSCHHKKMLVPLTKWYLWILILVSMIVFLCYLGYSFRSSLDIGLGKPSNEEQLVPQTITVSGVSFNMIPVEGGTFTMGATAEQGSDASSDEKPTHNVTLTSYYIGETEVTQALWLAVMGSYPSEFQGDNLPVEEISWDDCQIFINKLNQLTGKTFRLPTEAEWEFAARGGIKSQGYKYSGSNNLDEVARYDGNSGSHTNPVKTMSPNELGIYDMTGNVFEWCQDWYDNYTESSQVNPTGPSPSSYRVNRGGSWDCTAMVSRTTSRNFEVTSVRTNDIGFRLACSSFQ